MRAARHVLWGALALLGLGLGLGWLGAMRDTGASLTVWHLQSRWVWSGGADAVRRLAVGRRAGRKGAFVVALAGTRLVVLDASGRSLADGTTSPLTRFDVADVDGDGADEIAATEWQEQPPLQLFDERLRPLGPNVRLLAMGLPAALRAFDLDADGRRELVLADFRGCLSVLDYPRFLWDHCLTPGGGPSGDPFAVRSLAMLRAPRFGRLLVAVRESGETVALDARGTRRFRHAAGVDGLVDLLAFDHDGDAQDDVALATRNHGVLVLDAAGRLARSARVAGYSPAVTRLEWDGDARTEELLVAHDSGRLSLLALRPGANDPAGAEIAPAQVLHMASADVDRDGRDEILAALVTRELVLLAQAGGGLRVAASVAAGQPVERLLSFVADDGQPSFLAALGPRVQALAATFVRAPAWYSPVVATLLSVLVVGLVGWTLLRLRPPLPREDDLDASVRRQQR